MVWLFEDEGQPGLHLDFWSGCILLAICSRSEFLLREWGSFFTEVKCVLARRDLYGDEPAVVFRNVKSWLEDIAMHLIYRVSCFNHGMFPYGFFFVTKTEKIFRLLMWNSAFRDLEK